MEFTSIPLAFMAGVLSLLSPCVLPMIPAVTASAMRSSVLGLWYLAAGLCLSFALAGSVLTYLLLNLGLSPDILRTTSAILIFIMAVMLLSQQLSTRFNHLLSRLISHLPTSLVNGVGANGEGTALQFVIGLSLGLVWLPCVGPTLGTAIALASTGQSMLMAFTVMFSFGLGTALPLIGIGYWAGKSLAGLRSSAKFGKLLMGLALLIVALFILTGWDRILEVWAMQILPSWVIDI
ncbi:MAG: sulfite exporter TauE/SafE family protein [Pseudomonadales bacterium]|nr:sulfite exporter TauE/SafE family protein [Pseudomonadales bacterium]